MRRFRDRTGYLPVSKFKVGDKVRVTSYDYVSAASSHVGNEGIVVKNSEDEVHVFVTTPKHTEWPYLPTELELVEKAHEWRGFEPLGLLGALRALGVDISVEQYNKAIVIAEELFDEVELLED